MKKYGIPAKIICSLVLLSFVLWKCHFKAVFVTLEPTSFSWVLMGISLMVIQCFLGGFRWYYILKFINIAQPLHYSLKLFWISIFFNTCLPTGIAGDGIRILFLRKHTSTAVSFSSVFLDRLFGFSALFFLIGITIPNMYNFFKISFIHSHLFYLLFGLCILLTVLLYQLLKRNFLNFQPHNILKYLQKFIVTTHLIYKSWNKMLFLQAIAILGVLIQILSIYIFSLSLHLNIHLFHCFLIVPWVNLLTMIPISIGGWGIRENAMVFFLGLLGVANTPAFVLSFIYGCTTILISFPGAFFWIRFKASLKNGEVKKQKILISN